MEQAASQASTFMSSWPLLAHNSPSSLDRAGGAREAVGSDRPRGGEPHRNGTRWLSLLSPRKARVPNGSVRTIQRLRRQPGRFDFGGQLAAWRRTWPISTGQLADGCDPSEPNSPVIPSIGEATIWLFSIVD
jgi:hypothetical protein